MSNCRNRLTNHQHLLVREAVPSHDVAVRARGDDVVDRMPLRVINAVASKLLRGTAVHAEPRENVVQQVCGGHIALVPFGLVDALVGLHKEERPALWCCCPAAHALNPLRALLVGEIAPALLSAVAAMFALAVARPALVRQTKRPAAVSQKVVSSGWLHCFAAVASALRSSVLDTFVHAGILSRFEAGA